MKFHTAKVTKAHPTIWRNRKSYITFTKNLWNFIQKTHASTLHSSKGLTKNKRKETFFSHMPLCNNVSTRKIRFLWQTTDDQWFQIEFNTRKFTFLSRAPHKRLAKGSTTNSFTAKRYKSRREKIEQRFIRKKFRAQYLVPRF